VFCCWWTHDDDFVLPLWIITSFVIAPLLGKIPFCHSCVIEPLWSGVVQHGLRVLAIGCRGLLLVDS